MAVASRTRYARALDPQSFHLLECYALYPKRFHSIGPLCQTLSAQVEKEAVEVFLRVVRECISLAVFAVGLWFLVEMLAFGFSSAGLIKVVGCYIAAVIIWPTQKYRKREHDYWLKDLAESFVFYPFYAIGALFRFVFYLLRAILDD